MNKVETGETILDVNDLNGWYGESHVLHGIKLNVRNGELVTLLGRNGAGKTTTLRAIMGILGKKRGSIRIRGDSVETLPPEKIALKGVGYCPEERGIFSDLTVDENLVLPPVIKKGGMSIEEIKTLFPNLKERHAAYGNRLSGGEQQMLAIGRILRTGADLLLLDEPTEGLAPVIVQQIGVAIGLLKQRGYTVLLVEQNFHFAARIADRHYVVEEGKVVDEIANEDLTKQEGRLRNYLGV